MGKITKAQKSVLKKLSYGESGWHYLAGQDLRLATLLCRRGFVEKKRDDVPCLWVARITPAGRAALTKALGDHND